MNRYCSILPCYCKDWRHSYRRYPDYLKDLINYINRLTVHAAANFLSCTGICLFTLIFHTLNCTVIEFICVSFMSVFHIEERKKKGEGRRVGLGGQNPCRASCFVWVFMKQMVELICLFNKDQGKTASPARGIVEPIHLFKKDRGKTARAARILSPNPT